MAKKSKPEMKLGATVRFRAQSGEIVEGRVMHMWEDKSVPMVWGVWRSRLQRSGAYAGRWNESEMTFCHTSRHEK
jgi:hypothetical protein